MIRRRTLLGGVLGVSVTAAAGAAGGAGPAFATSSGTVLPLVEPLPTGAPDRTLFDPREQVLASYLTIVAPLANSVVDDDEELFGWMEDGWWRTPVAPYNARIMEQVATLSWFAAHPRPWNPYHRDPALLDRLDAALGYYLALQNADGSWPEAAPGSSDLPAAGFGTVSLAATYADLAGGGLLPERQQQIATALRASSAWLLDLGRGHWAIPIKVSNQVTGGLSGVAQAAHVLGDAGISAPLAERCARLLEHGQAPAGFFNDALSYDHGYNFGVMLPDLADVWELTRDPSVLELVRRWGDWFGLVTVLEPGETFGFPFAAACSRVPTSTFSAPAEDTADKPALSRVFLADVPALAALHPSAEEKQRARQRWATDPAPVPALVKQQTDPRLFLHLPRSPDGVTSAERDAQLARLPYVDDAPRTEVREGTVDQRFVLVRREGYYLASVYGRRDPITLLQRMGPGLVWHPRAGAVLVATNVGDDDSWATVGAGARTDRSDVDVTFTDGPDGGGGVLAPAELAGRTGLFSARYRTTDQSDTEEQSITTTVSHWQDSLVREVVAGGPAFDQVPLVLHPDDLVELSDGTSVRPGTAAETSAAGLVLSRGADRFHLSWAEPLPVRLTPATSFHDGTRQHHLLRIEHPGSLRFELTVLGAAPAPGELDLSATAVRHRTAGGTRVELHVLNAEADDLEVAVVGAPGLQHRDRLGPGASLYLVVEDAGQVAPRTVRVTARSLADGRRTRRTIVLRPPAGAATEQAPRGDEDDDV